MPDFNIIVKNMLGKGKSSSNRLSAKGSIQRQKDTISSINGLKRVTGMTSSTLSSINSGSSGANLVKAAKGAGLAGAAIGALIVASEKVMSFGINIREAKTGEQVWAHNAKTTLKTVTSLGGNYLFGYAQNELFNKKVISRQNYGLDYGREIYQMNNEGYKTKRI
jgi:hypothetical protein